MTFTLSYEKREGKQKPPALRRSGRLPAVFYGRKEKATPISVGMREFEKLWGKAGESAVVTLFGEGGGELEALIHDVDRHPVTGIFRHADFYVFEKGQKLKVKIPIEFTGIAPVVKDLGGVLVKVLHELEVEAEPKHLPQKIEVDISSLATFESVILAKSIALPKEVVLVTSFEEVVASVYEPKEEVVEEVAAPDLSTIEVAKKGKEVKEDELASAPSAEKVAVPEKGAKREAK